MPKKVFRPFRAKIVAGSLWFDTKLEHSKAITIVSTYSRDARQRKFAIYLEKKSAKKGFNRKFVFEQHQEIENRSKNRSTTALLRRYASKARQYNPTIPSEVALYLVEAYVGLRQSQQQHNKYQAQHDQTVNTPRQLLSIMRLSQALLGYDLHNLLDVKM